MTCAAEAAFEWCLRLSALEGGNDLRAAVCEAFSGLLGAHQTLLFGFDLTREHVLVLSAFPSSQDISPLPVGLLKREAHPLLDLFGADTGLVENEDGSKATFASLRALLGWDGAEGRAVALPCSVSADKRADMMAVALIQRETPLAKERLETVLKFASFAARFLSMRLNLKAAEDDNRMLSVALSNADSDRLRMQQSLPRALMGSIVGSSPAMVDVRAAIAKYAPTDTSVVLLGPTGTGKEVAARELHRMSARADGPFVAVNVAALPETLAEAELFGHAKGAFTGAEKARIGHILSADGGTLFLDEIGDMPFGLQAKLLRVLQDRRFRPVGSDVEKTSDFRLIAATHRDLRTLVREGSFREDLYYRLAAAKIVLPPLSDRGDDVIELTRHFLNRHARLDNTPGKTLSERALEHLKQRSFQGNVRELEALIADVWLESGSERIITEAHFPSADYVINAALTCEGIDRTGCLSLKDACETFERAFLLRRLKEQDGDRKKTADVLAIPRTTLNSKLKKHGLEGLGPDDVDTEAKSDKQTIPSAGEVQTEELEDAASAFPPPRAVAGESSSP